MIMKSSRFDLGRLDSVVGANTQSESYPWLHNLLSAHTSHILYGRKLRIYFRCCNEQLSHELIMTEADFTVYIHAR